MNNNKKYSFEELKLSLPDYLKNNIEDIELYKTIQNKLETDNELNKELEELQNTLNFLRNSEFSNPPDNYFNNLSVRINEKIELNEIKISWWEKLSLLWKILIPVIPVAIIIIFLLTNYSGNKTSGSEIVNENSTEITKPENISETNKEKIEIIDETKISKDKIEKSLISDSKTDLNQIQQKSLKINKFNSKPESDNILNNKGNILQTSETEEFITDPDTESSDIFSSDIFAGNIDLENEEDSETESETENEDFDLLYQNDINNDKSIEDEIQKLTQEEQHEIFNNLINSKL